MQNNSLVVFFAIPLLIGISIGWNKPQATVEMSLIQTLLYWTIVWGVMWISSFGLTSLLFRRYKTLNYHRRKTQFLAAFLSLILLRAVMPLWIIIVNSLGESSSLVAIDFVNEFGFYPSNAQQLGQYIYHGIFPITVWMVINILFDFMGASLYVTAVRKPLNTKLADPQPQHDADSRNRPDAIVQKPPFFLNNTPNIKVSDIIAMSAEDHYVRIVTQHKETLIYCRFSDCLHEMDAIEGIRIHRSHWVRKDAINKIERQGRKAMVRFTNGMTLPVSQTYLGSLEQLIKV